MITGTDARPIRRGFVPVGDRLVHYRCAGEGSPVVLLHDSPRSSVLHLPLLQAFSDDFRVYALDTPGYGQSDPLPVEPRPEIDDFGDALAGALRALGLQRPAVYAYHTSSKIALSCAVRHPGLIGRLVIDGLSLPRDPVPEEFIAAYMSPFVVDSEGAYIGKQWTRIRDLHRFFPWFGRTLETRLPLDEPSPAAMHAYAMDLFMAGEHFSSAYAAAMRYRALEALPRLDTPTTFMARANDVLYPYLDTLEAGLPACAEVIRLPADDEAWRDRLRSLFASVDGDSSITVPTGSAPPRRRYQRHPHGDLHLRDSGGEGEAVIVLHDPPGSGFDVAALSAALSARRVIAPDLPGCGLSDPLGPAAGCADYVAALAAMAEREGFEKFALVGVGLAAPIAAALAVSEPSRVSRLVLDGMPVMSATQRRDLAACYAPPIEPSRDGSHFMSTWHRLRDEQMQWPWFDGTQQAARRIEPDLDARHLHERLVATLLQPVHYGDACRAALEVDVTELLAGLPMPVMVVDAPGDPRHAGAARLAAAAPNGRCAPRRPAVGAGARLIAMFLEERGQAR